MSISSRSCHQRQAAPPLRARARGQVRLPGAVLCVAVGLLALSASACSRPLPPEGKNELVIRGQQQDVYFYPSPGGAKNAPKVLFLCGDGGWEGFAPEIAAEMAKAGYDVYGFDTKRYLESFTTDGGALKEDEVQRDLARVAGWMRTRWGERVTLVGWSQGAGMAVLAAAAPEGKPLFSGVVTFGLSSTAELGWSLRDDVTYITGADPDEPMFRVSDYLSRVSPLPLCMIQSSGDQLVPREEAEGLFGAAQKPKQYKLVEARNHGFGGNTGGFFEALRGGLWMGGADRTLTGGGEAYALPAPARRARPSSSSCTSGR